MKDNKVNLILCGTALQSIWEFTNEEGLEKYYAFYGHRSRCLTLLRKLWFFYNFPLKEIWIRKELRKIEGKCIVLDEEASLFFLDWFYQNRKESGKIIFYYWNLCAQSKVSPDAVKELGYEVWSFDRLDCEKYKIRWNPQFYCDSWYKNIDKNSVCYDISFIGRDKSGRMQKILDLVKRFGQEKYRWNLHFMAHHWYNVLSDRRYCRFCKLPQMLTEEMKANAILDFSRSDQGSITLRSFDALCNERKLITNILAIKNEEFYDKDNVFIIDEDADEDFENFITGQFSPIDKQILEKREFKNWVKMFWES